MEAPRNDDIESYRKFKLEFAPVLADIAEAFRTLVERGDEKGVASFSLLLLAMAGAAQQECEKMAWPTNFSQQGIGQKVKSQ